jgi:hypothetical protein
MFFCSSVIFIRYEDWTCLFKFMLGVCVVLGMRFEEGFELAPVL